MKLEKAIEILSLSAYSGSTTHSQDFKDALKLGIEALKRTQVRREHLSWKFEPPLPGETPEGDSP